MTSYCIGFSLPSNVTKSIAPLCCGLPDVHWIEPVDFTLVLCQLGHLNGEELADLKESIKDLEVHELKVRLKGLGATKAPARYGQIWVNVEPTESLFSLRKQLKYLLDKINIQPKDQSFFPRVPIGDFEGISPDRLSEYLYTHHYYVAHPFDMEGISLFEIQKNGKSRLIFQKV